MTIPYFVNCDNKEIFVCDYFMHPSCKETCAYANDVRGLGIGAGDGGAISRLEKEIEDGRIV